LFGTISLTLIWLRGIFFALKGVRRKMARHLGFISIACKTRKIKLVKLNTAYRIIWDKEWHGGNGSKAACPHSQSIEEGIGCGDCGLPDSQHHWI